MLVQTGIENAAQNSTSGKLNKIWIKKEIQGVFAVLSN
jgi:hypothetical protein